MLEFASGHRLGVEEPTGGQGARALSPSCEIPSQPTEPGAAKLMTGNSRPNHPNWPLAEPSGTITSEHSHVAADLAQN